MWESEETDGCPVIDLNISLNKSRKYLYLHFLFKNRPSGIVFLSLKNQATSSNISSCSPPKESKERRTSAALQHGWAPADVVEFPTLDLRAQLK